MNLKILALVCLLVALIDLVSGGSGYYPNPCYDKYYVNDLKGTIVNHRMQIWDYQLQTKKNAAEREELMKKVAKLEAEKSDLTEKLSNVTSQLESSREGMECIETKFNLTKNDTRKCVELQTVEEYRRRYGLPKNNTEIMQNACARGNVAVVRALFDQGLSCQTILGSDGFNCLHWASVRGKRDLTIFLLSRGSCDINARTNYQNTPIIYAAREGHLAVVQELYKSGAEVSLRGSSNQTALGNAKRNKLAVVVQYLQSINAPD